jgi:hypothetical protein
MRSSAISVGGCQSGEWKEEEIIIASFLRFYLLLDRRKSRPTSHGHLKAIVEWIRRIRVRVYNPVEHKDGPAAIVLPVRSHVVSSRLVFNDTKCL